MNFSNHPLDVLRPSIEKLRALLLAQTGITMRLTDIVTVRRKFTESDILASKTGYFALMGLLAFVGSFS